MKNKAGKFVEPTLEATSAAAANIEVKPNLTFFTGWADGDESYPIAAQTWIIAYQNQTDKAKGEALKAFLTYLLTEGQTKAPDVDFAALPDALTREGDGAARSAPDPLLRTPPDARRRPEGLRRGPG